MKRFKLSYLAVFLVCALILSACAESQITSLTSTTTKSVETTTTESTSAEPTNASSSSATDSTQSGEVITLTAFRDMPASPANWSWGDDPTSRWITEKTGIQIEVTSAADGTGTQLSTMLASGDKLPDFIISSAKKASRRLLIGQGFVQPLNKLADEYYPDFWAVLPNQIDTIYKESDGNFYFVTDWYGDPEKANVGEVNNFTPVSFNINKAIYNEMGSPDISTWEKFVAHLGEVKSAHPEIEYMLYDQAAQGVDYNRGLCNLVARFYGAQNDYYEKNSDDSITFLPLTSAYQSMLKECNKLFRSGLLNAEMYTHASNSEQQREVMLTRNFYAYVGYYWTMIEMMGLPLEEEYFSIDFPLPEGSDKSKFHVYSDFYSIGGNATYITTDTEMPAECIKYYSFLLSDEGQFAHRYGTEGYTFDFDEQGVPKYTKIKNDAEAEGFDVLQRVYGVHNYNFSWLTQNWVALLGAKYTYPYVGIINHFKLVEPYMKNERLADMTWALSDEEGLLLKEQLINLWRSEVPQIITATNDGEFNAAYDKFINDLKTAGVERFNQIISENRINWISKGLGAD